MQGWLGAWLARRVCVEENLLMQAPAGVAGTSRSTSEGWQWQAWGAHQGRGVGEVGGGGEEQGQEQAAGAPHAGHARCGEAASERVGLR